MLDQLEILRKELTVVEQRLQRLLHDEANRDAPESLPGPADSSPALNEVRDQLLFAEAAYYAVYRDQDTLHSDLEAVTWVVNDPAVEEQLREKNRAEEHFEYLSVVNGRLHWGTIAAAEELEAAQTLMDQRIQMAAEQIRKNYQSLLAVEGKMSGVSENTGKTYSPQTVSELSIFQREVNSKRERYYQFYDTVNTAMKSIHSGAVHARIIKRAQP
jgi:uncharacterized protein involved in exopolysaccharide biosynthesis